MKRGVKGALIALAALGADIAAAQTPQELQRGYEAAARQEASAFSGFSAQRGEAFFHSAHGSDWSCATCHTRNPMTSGKHTVTGRQIAPLAPAANSERFTDAAKAEKWFKRNCNDVLHRACTATEKGDVIAYLMSLR